MILTPAEELDAVVVGVVYLWVMDIENGTKSTLRPENRSSVVAYHRDDTIMMTTGDHAIIRSQDT